MKLDDVTISRLIIQSYNEKLVSLLTVDAALVGAGPANLTAGYYLAKAGLRAVIIESKLAPGGGMWGGGMMFNEAVVQEDALPILEEMNIRTASRGDGYYTFDTVEAAAGLAFQCVHAGTSILNCVKAEDVMFREDNGQKRICGLVLNWSPVTNLGLHIDPLSMQAGYVVDGTGHPAEICSLITRKMGVRLNNETGEVVGELPLWADEGEQFTVVNTNEVFPGLIVSGMAANNAYGGPRMGPIFGGMLLSGKKGGGHADRQKEGRCGLKRMHDVHLYCFSPGGFAKGRDPREVVQAQIRGGADVIQLREKNASKRQKLEMGRMIRLVTHEMGALFIVNDDLDLAMILDADGLHLGQDDLPISAARPYLKDKIIGVSTHSLDQAQKAIEDGADYIGIGPVFATLTKKNPDPVVGPDLAGKVISLSPIPVVAIGGITLANVDQVVQAGGRCAAVVTDILNADDIKDRARRIKRQLLVP